MDASSIRSILESMRKNPVYRNNIARGALLNVYSDYESLSENTVIPTGWPELDYTLLGNTGGLPCGRIVEIYGIEGSGKSTIAMRVIANAQKMGLPCALFDTELVYSDAFARDWLVRQGVDIQSLAYCPEQIAELVLNAVHSFFKSGGRVAVIDSIAGSLAMEQSIEYKAEEKAKGAYGERTVGALARVWSEGLKNLNHVVVSQKSLLICTNQVRQKIGGFNPYGLTVYETPGGHLAKHLYSIRLKVDKVQPIVEGGKQVGIWSKCTVKKNKVTPTEGWETKKNTLNHLPIYFDGRTVDGIEALLTAAIEKGVIERRGPRIYAYRDVQASGKDNFMQAIKEAGLEDEIKEALTGSVYTSDGPDYIIQGDD